MITEKKPFLAYRSFHTPMNTIGQFASAGYETICVFPAHTCNSRGTPYSQYHPVWLWYDRLDFSPFDTMIADVSTAMPEAELLCMIDLNAPVWLEHMNPHRCADSFNNLGRTIHNPQWREPTEAFLRKFLHYSEEKYGDRIKAYILACGATDEWYDYSNGAEDNASDRRDAWRKWCRNHGYGDPVDIPPQSVRESAAHETFLRTPEQNLTAIRYWKFCNEAIADAIVSFASVARSCIRKETQIGCFYGYILEKSEKELVSCGHLEYERVLDSPDLDFLISPGTYTDRAIGGGSGFLIPNGTASVRGKRLLHECDQRTHTSNHYLTPYITLKAPGEWEDEASTLAGLKREASLALLKQANLWWFDMWGDFYQGEAVMKLLKQIRGLWNSYAGNVGADRSETALIVDPESTYLVNENHPVSGEIHLGMRNKLNRLGAPFEVYSFRDIPRIADFERFRLLIFNSAFLITPEKQEILKRFVLCGGRTVLWLCAPGITDGVRFAPERCGALTGIPYGTDGVTARSMGDWTSVYCHDYRTVTPALLRELASAAGVRLVAERELPVVFSGSLLSVHTKEGGRMSLHVPEEFRAARELFTGTSLSVKNGILEYTFQTPDTGLFDLFRSAETEASEPV